ncbi:helix-turn-helix domain-containing protein [Megalodesulfovibrio paquesii]
MTGKQPMAMARRIDSVESPRNGRAIRAYLVRKGISMADIARDLECSRSLVCHTVRGGKNNKRVLARLVELGVPRRYLALPDGVGVAA